MLVDLPREGKNISEGVAIVIKNEQRNKILDIHAINEIIMEIVLNAIVIVTSIVIYGPTA